MANNNELSSVEPFLSIVPFWSPWHQTITGFMMFSGDLEGNIGMKNTFIVSLPLILCKMSVQKIVDVSLENTPNWVNL